MLYELKWRCDVAKREDIEGKKIRVRLGGFSDVIGSNSVLRTPYIYEHTF